MSEYRWSPSNRKKNWSGSTDSPLYTIEELKKCGSDNFNIREVFEDYAKLVGINSD